jgi:hypothetical protein
LAKRRGKALDFGGGQNVKSADSNKYLRGILKCPDFINRPQHGKRLS